MTCSPRASSTMQHYYEKLMEEFPKSNDTRLRLQRFGRDCLSEKRFSGGLALFNDGTDKIAASQKMKDLTVGRAKTLLALQPPR